MKATVLIENAADEGLEEEWGLSILIDTGGRKILLDTGKSGKFAGNAEKMGIDLSEVEFGVLSHAHYDHADGMETFFEKNSHAKFYIRKGSGENCYKKVRFSHKYIGIRKGILEKYKDRIVFADGNEEVVPGCFLIPHTLKTSFKVNKMCVRKDHRWQTDLFEHEQSLVFDTPEGLVIFSSCSHTGVDNVLKEAVAAVPGRPVYAVIGGFHLFERPEEEVRRLAAGIRESGVEKVYTGHCTGDAAYDILKEELGDKLNRLKTGLVMEL